jgi:hypothetical protein
MLTRYAFIAVERERVSINRQEPSPAERATWRRYNMEDISAASWERLNRILETHSWLMGAWDGGIGYMTFRKDLTKVIRSARVMFVPKQGEEP